MRAFLVSAGLTFWIGSLGAETVKDREGAVREDAARMEANERWIYNDVEAGFAEARRSGKPLMVVLRCVPCLACMGLDSEVLLESGELAPLMDRFVRVRVINANALDLSLFQFDYDLSFSVLFFSPRREVLGRFGSWEHQKDAAIRTTGGLRQAMEGVLRLHAEDAGKRAGLEGKKGKSSGYATPIDLPGLKGRFASKLDWDGQVVKSCVHCHQIGDALRSSLREAGEPLPLRLIYPYPPPETIGLGMQEAAVTVVRAVEPDSIAAHAGLLPGDRLETLAGQPLISLADLSWVLHQAPDEGNLVAEVERDGQRVHLTATLPPGWRRKADISRRVGTWPMRAMAFGGMKLEELEDAERDELGIVAGKLALRAAHVGEYNEHAAAKKAGFLKGDVLVEVDGSDAAMSESALLGLHLTTFSPGQRVPATVLRGGKRLELRIPVQ